MEHKINVLHYYNVQEETTKAILEELKQKAVDFSRSSSPLIAVLRQLVNGLPITEEIIMSFR